MTFTAGVFFSFINPYEKLRRMRREIIFTLTGKNSITDYLDYLILKLNEILFNYYSSDNAIISYTYNKNKLTFSSNIQYNNNLNLDIHPRFSFFGDAIKIFNITEDMQTKDFQNPNNYINMLLLNPIQGLGRMTVEMMIDSDFVKLGRPANNDGNII
jgi:hypothetical protein